MQSFEYVLCSKRDLVHIFGETLAEIVGPTKGETITDYYDETEAPAAAGTE